MFAAQKERPATVAAVREAVTPVLSEAKLVGGIGRHHTENDTGKNRPKPYQSVTLAQIFDEASSPPSVPKDSAPWVIFSTHRSRNAAEQREHGEFYALWADFDEALDAPTVDDLDAHTCSRLGPVRRLLYSTRSATEAAPKYRLIVPLAQPCPGARYGVLQQILADKLRAPGLKPDMAAIRPNQVCYRPNRGEHYEHVAHPDLPLFDPATAWIREIAEADAQHAAEAQARQERLAQARAAATTATAAGLSVIDACNEHYSLPDLLASYGYAQRESAWISPFSQTGSAGVRLSADGRHWFSFHGSDAAAGIGKTTDDSGQACQHGDAFDLICFWEHANDRKAALHALGQRFTTSEGVSLEKQNQRNYMAAKEAETAASAAEEFAAMPVDDFPDPLPLADALLPVMPFDFDLLPEAVRPWVADVAERMQCPPDFPAVATMVALSAAIGQRAAIEPKRMDDWRVRANLWGMFVGRPGVMKSPASGAGTLPLRRLAAEAADAFEEQRRDFEVERQLADMQAKADENAAAKAVKSGDTELAREALRKAQEGTPQPPTLRRYIVNDATFAALTEVLIENPLGVLLDRDEIDTLLRGLGRDEKELDRQLLLQAYDGESDFVSDRIMRGKHLRIPAPCLGVLGGIQPARLARYVADVAQGGENDYGLLQRFGIMVWPDISGEWKNVDRWPDTDAKTATYEVFKRLAEMQPRWADNGDPIPVVRKFTNPAQKLFDEWRVQFEIDLRKAERPPALESHFAKYRKLIPAIALVCSMADDEDGAVSERSLLRALAWAEYLKSHALRVYHSGGQAKFDAARELLRKIKAGKVAESFKARDIYRHQWRALTDTQTVSHAAEVLVDHRVLFAHEQPAGVSGGRPTVSYSINPKVLE